ncbi:MAG: hypothetical protein CMK32_08550 [Porticoccaceae bacterium]|nr:hypothetical protein [Porticoccaceae bacterium]
MQAINRQSKKFLMIQLSKNSIVRNTSVSSGSGRVPVAVRAIHFRLSAERLQISLGRRAMAEEPHCHR